MKMQPCWHACPVRGCKWEYKHDVPETMDPGLCQYWKRCPDCAFFQASNINHGRRAFDAKNKTVTAVDQTTEVQESGEPWREEDIPPTWTSAFCATGEVLESLQTSCERHEVSTDSMHFLSE